MKTNRFDFTKIVLVLVVLMAILTIGVACNPSDGGAGSAQMGNGVVSDGDGSGVSSGSDVVSSTTMVNSAAVQMIYDAMDKSLAEGRIGQQMMNFEFSTFFELEHELTTTTYYVDFKGALDISGNNASTLSIVFRKVLDGVESELFGIYAIGDSIYFDLRNVSATEGIHVLKIDDFDLEWVASTLQSLFDELDLGGFLGDYDISGLFSSLPSIVSSLLGGVLDKTVALIVQKLAGDGTTAVLSTDVNGIQTLHIPLAMLNNLFGTVLGMVPSLLGLISSDLAADDIYELTEMLFGWDLASVMSALGASKTSLELALNATLVDGYFQSMDFEIGIVDKRTDAQRTSTDAKNPYVDYINNPYYNNLFIHLGANNFTLGTEPVFDLPDFTNVETEDFSLTTLNADIYLDINAKTHTYTINTIDAAMGGFIASLLADTLDLSTGLGDMPISIDSAVFRLHLKLRAEIDLKDNSNTNGLVEIYGTEDDVLRAGLYYSGVDEALYVDLTGMGSGRYKIGTYAKTTTTTKGVKSADGEVVLMADGCYVNYLNDDGTVKDNFTFAYDGTTILCPSEFVAATSAQISAKKNVWVNAGTASKPNYKKLSEAGGSVSVNASGENVWKSGSKTSSIYYQVPLERYKLITTSAQSTETINLTAIIKDALDNLIATQVPSIARLISGGFVAKANSSASSAAETSAIYEALQNGDVLIENYISEDATASASIGTSVNTFSLIKQILSCVEITRGESRLSFDTIMISLTDEVVSVIAGLISPGLVLPVTKADILIDSTGGFGLNGIYIDLALGTDEEPDLLTLSLPIELEYGRHLEDWEMPNFADSNNPFVEIPITTDAEGNLSGFDTIALSLSGSLRLQAGQSVWDMSALQQLIYGLLVQLNVDGAVDLNLGFDIDVNLNINTISTDTLNSIGARISLYKDPDGMAEEVMTLYLVKGKLYIDALPLGLPRLMLDIGKLTSGIDFKSLLFATNPYDNAEAAADEEESSGVDALAIVAAILTGVNLSSNALEVTIVTNLVSVLVNLLAADNPDIQNNDVADFIDSITVDEGSGLAITFDGLNLSELYIDLSVGVSMEDGGSIDLGLGLGHILVSLEAFDLEPVNAADFNDILTKLNVYLALDLSVGIEMAQNEFDIDTLAGAILGDLALNVNIQEAINPGLAISLDANLDLANLPQYNQTELKLEIYGIQTGMMIAGIYYSSGMLYVDVGAIGLEKFYMPLDLISLIKGLLTSDDEEATGSALSLAEDAFDGVKLIAMLSDKRLQVEVGGALTAALITIVCDAINTDGSNDALVETLKQNGSLDNLNIPDLGVTLAVTWADDEDTPLLNALGLDLSVDMYNQNHQKVFTLFASVGGLEIGVKARDILGELDLTQFTYVPLIEIGEGGTSDVTFNLENIYLETIGYIQLNAFESSPEDTYTQLGSVLLALLDAEKSDGSGAIITDPQVANIFEALSNVFIRMQVLNNVEKYIGFRIAANLYAAPLLAGGDINVAEILLNSELAVEIYYGKYEANNDPIIGMYLQNGMLYVRANGTIANDLRLKINLMNISAIKDLFADSEEGSGSAMASGEEYEGLIPTNVLDILNGVLDSLNITRSELAINLNKNLIGAILDLVLGTTGLNLLEINSERSRVWFSADDGISVNLALGIDPVMLGLSIGNIKLGFSQGEVIPISEENKFELEYKSLADVDTLSLSVGLGINLTLNESSLPVGDIVSQFVDGLNMALNLELEDNAEVSIYANVAANLNLASPEETEIAFEIYLARDTIDELLIAVYLDGADIYANFPALDIAPFKVTDIEAVTALLNTVADQLGGLLRGIESSDDDASGAGAMATADDEETMDLIVALSDNYIKLQITTALIAGILEMLPTFGVDIESDLLSNLVDLIKTLGVSAELGYDTHNIVIDVSVITDYLSLGIWVGKPYLSLEPIDGVLSSVEAEKEMYTDFMDEGNVYAELEFAIRYRLTEKSTALNSLLGTLLGDTELLGMSLGELFKELLVSIAVQDNASGQIGLKIMANIELLNLIDALGDTSEITVESIFEMIELGIEITIGDKAAYIALIDYDEDGDEHSEDVKYIFLKLDEFGAPNLKMSFNELITAIGGLSDGSASSNDNALSTAETVSAPLSTLSIVNALLGLDGNYIGIGTRGLTINLAYDIIAQLVMTLLGETFETVDAVIENGTETTDDRLYIYLDGGYVLYDATNPLHQDTDDTVYTKYYKTSDGTVAYKYSADGTAPAGYELSDDRMYVKVVTTTQYPAAVDGIADEYTDKTLYYKIKNAYDKYEYVLTSEYTEDMVKVDEFRYEITGESYVLYNENDSTHEHLIRYYKIKVPFTDEMLQVMYFVNEKTDDSAYVLVSDVENGEVSRTNLMDNRPYVKVDGEYVVYDSSNSDHEGLVQYYKIRSTGITFKLNDPKNNGNKSFNIDLALNAGIDLGFSIYGYHIGFSKDNLAMPLGDKAAYPNIRKMLLEDKIFISIDGYIELAGLRDENYDIAPLLKTFLGDNATLSGLTDLLLAVCIEDFDNLIEFRLSVNLSLGSILADDFSAEKLLSDIELSFVLFRTLDDGTEEKLIGFYLLDNDLYIDMRTYNALNGNPNTEVVRIAGFGTSIVGIIGGLLSSASAEDDELKAFSTEITPDDEFVFNPTKLGAAVIIGSSGFGVAVYTDLINTILQGLVEGLDLAGVFGDISATVMINFDDIETIQDISLDVAVNVGALKIGLGISNIIIDINTTNAVVPEDIVVASYNIVDMPITLHGEVQLSLIANNGVVDIGALLSGVLPGVSLEVQIPDENGTSFDLNLSVDIAVNLSDFNTLELALELTFGGITDDVLLIGIYYTAGVIYVDATGLGIEKLKITGLDVGGLLEDLFGSALGHQNAGGMSSASASASTTTIDPALAAVAIILDGKRISVQVATGLLEWVLSIPSVKEAVGTYIPDNLTLDAYLDLNYINEDSGLFDLSLELKAIISDMLGIGLKIFNLEYGFQNIDLVNIADPYNYVEILELGFAYEEAEDGSFVLEDGEYRAYNEDTDSGMTRYNVSGLSDPVVKLEHVNLSLEVDLFSVMSGADDGVMDLSDLLKPLLSSVADVIAQINLSEDVIRKLALRVSADVELLNVLSLDFDNLDVMALLNYINASVEIVDYTSSSDEKLLIGIYLKDGSAYLYLEGIGFDNIYVSQSFISSILTAVGVGSASSEALSTADDTLNTVASIINSLISSIDITGKTIMVVLKDSYVTELIKLISPDFEIETPDLALGLNAISINLNRGYYTSMDDATDLEMHYAYDTEGKYVPSYKVENGVEYVYVYNTAYTLDGTGGNMFGWVAYDETDAEHVELKAAGYKNYNYYSSFYTIDSFGGHNTTYVYVLNKDYSPYSSALDYRYVWEEYDATNEEHINLLANGREVDYSLKEAGVSLVPRGIERFNIYVNYDGDYTIYDETNELMTALPKYIRVERNGFLEVDLSFYDSKLGLYVVSPTIGVSELDIELPECKWADAANVKGVSIELRGSFGLSSDGVTAADGITLGSVFGGLLGDLDANILLESNFTININYEINAYVGFDYKFNPAVGEKAFTITALDLSIKMLRANDNNVLVNQASIVYSSAKETVYVDLSYFKMPKLAVSGLSLTDLINGLIPATEADDGASGGALSTEDAISSVSALEGIFSNTASIYGVMQPNFFAVGLSAKLIFGLVKLIAGSDADSIVSMIPNLGVELSIETNPFTLGLVIQLQDKNCDKIVDIFLTFNGFDWDEYGQTGGSDIRLWEEGEYLNDYISIDTNEYSNIIKLNLGSDKDEDAGVLTKDGILADNLSLTATLSLELEALKGFRNWASYFSNIFALDSDALNLIIDVMEQDSLTMLTISIDANVNVQNLLASPMSLKGTEARITISFDSTITNQTENAKNGCIVITAVGTDAGKLKIFLDMSKYRSNGQHYLELDISDLLGGVDIGGSLFGSASSAEATADDTNYGLLGESVFNILNGLLGSTSFINGEIAINVNPNMLNNLFGILLENNPNFTAEDLTFPEVTGGITINLNTFKIGIDINFDENNGNMSIGIGIGLSDIALSTTPIEVVKDSGSLLPENSDNFTDLLAAKLDISLMGTLSYSATQTSIDNPAVDLSSIFTLITNDAGISLVQNPLFQISIQNDFNLTNYIYTDIYIDLANFNNMKITFEVYRDYEDISARNVAIGLYVDGYDIYADISALGIPKIKIEGVNLGKIIDNALSGVLSSLGSASSEEATSAASSTEWDNQILNRSAIPYFAMVVAPERFAIGVNAAIINELIKTIYRSKGQVVDGDIIPNFADIAIILDSRSRYIEATDIELASEKYTKYVLSSGEYVKATSAQILDPTIIKYVEATTPTAEIAVKFTETFGAALKLETIRINGSDSDIYDGINSIVANRYDMYDGFDMTSDASYDEATASEIADVSVNKYIKVGTTYIITTDSVTLNNPSIQKYVAARTTYTGFMQKIYDGQALAEPEFVTAYNVETGDIGLEKIALGLDINIAANTPAGVNDTSSANYENSFQYYLACLLKALLGSENSTVADYAMTIAQNSNIVYSISIKAVVDVASLITDTGFNIAGILESELSIEVFIKTYNNKKILGIYKMQDDDTLYVDLSGLGLPKVQVFGLGSLLGGISSASSSSALTTEAQSSAADTTADLASASIVLDEGLVKIELDAEFLYQILNYAGMEIEGTSDGFKSVVTYANDGTATYIPLPNIQTISVSINMLEKLDSIDLSIILDQLGSKLSLTIDNISITTDTEEFIPDSSMPTDDSEYGALFLSSGADFSMLNLAASLIGGLDANLGISLSRTSRSNLYEGGGNIIYGNTFISVRTSGSNDTKINGDKMGANTLWLRLKLENKASSMSVHQLDVIVINTQIILDISELFQGSSLVSLIGGFINELNLSDLAGFNLDLISILGGIGSSSAAATTEDAAATAMAEEEDATASASIDSEALGAIVSDLFGNIFNFNGLETLDIVKSLITGIKIDWWNATKSNAGTEGGSGVTTPSTRYTSIRVDLNPDLVNRLFIAVDYIIYALSNNLTAAEGQAFAALSYAEQVAFFGPNSTSGKLANLGSNLYDWLIEILNGVYSIPVLGDLGNVLDGISSVRNNIKDLLESIIPFPIVGLDSTGTTVGDIDCYIDIVLDKGPINSKDMSLVSEIGVYFNTKKNENYKSDGKQCLALVINNNGLNVKSASSFNWYNTGEEAAGQSLLAQTYTVSDAFNAWELESNALHDSARLPQHGYVTFTDGTNTKNSGGEMDITELGGTRIIWDTTTVDLTPGATSYMRGYCLNQLVGTVEVSVGSQSAFKSLYGYIDSDGNWIKSGRLIVDPLGSKGTANACSSLPETIVVLLNSGRYAVLSTNYGDNDYEQPVIAGVTDKANAYYGTFGYITNEREYETLDGEMIFSFWFKVNNSAKITAEFQLVRTDRTVSEIYFPSGAEFGDLDMLFAGTFDPLTLTANNIDIVSNINKIQTIDVRYENGSYGTLSVTFDTDRLERSYNEAKPYYGVDSYIVATVGEKEGLGTDGKGQKITKDVKIASRRVEGIEKTSGTTTTLEYNPYDGSISVKGGGTLKFMMSEDGAAPVATELDRSLYNIVIPDNLSEDTLSYKGGASFTATIYIGGYVDADGEHIASQSKEIKVRVLEKIARTVNVQLKDYAEIWNLAVKTAANSKVNYNINSITSASVVFADGTTSVLSVQSLELLSGQIVTNKGGMFTAKITVSDADGNNQQTLSNATLVIPRAWAVADGTAIGDDTKTATYYKGNGKIKIYYANGTRDTITNLPNYFSAVIDYADLKTMINDDQALAFANAVAGDTVTATVGNQGNIKFNISSESYVVAASIGELNVMPSIAFEKVVLSISSSAADSKTEDIAVASADDEDTELGVVSIVDEQYRSIIVDPMKDEEVKYPSTVEVELKDGTIATVNAEFVSFDIDDLNFNELPYTVLKVSKKSSDDSTSADYYENKQFSGCDYPNACVKFWWNDKFTYFVVPVQVLDRVIVADDISHQITISNPYTFNGDYFSPSFSLQKYVTVEYQSGESVKYPLVWETTDLAPESITTVVTKVVTVTYGGGMAPFSQDIQVIFKAYMPTAEKLSDLQKELYNHVFHAYTLYADGSDNPRKLSNYPSTVSVKISPTDTENTELSVLWDLTTLNYDYNGGDTVVTAYIGTPERGYQATEFIINVLPCVIDNVTMAEISPNLNLLDCGKSAPTYNGAEITEATVTYADIEGSFTERVYWDMSTVEDGLTFDGGTFTVHAIFRKGEFAGEQAKEYSVNYMAMSLTGITKTDGSAIFSNTDINPYSVSPLSLPTDGVKATFSYNDGSTKTASYLFANKNSEYIVSWNKANYDTSYDSAGCFVTAKLSYSGMSTSYIFSFNVLNYYVSQFSWDGSSYCSVSDGIIANTKTIDPFSDPDNYDISSSFYVIYNIYNYGLTLDGTYNSTDTLSTDYITISGSTLSYSINSKTGSSALTAVDHMRYSATINNVEYTFTLVKGMRVITIGNLGSFRIAPVTPSSSNAVQVTALVNTSGDFKVSYEGGNYKVYLAIGTNESLTLNVDVINRSYYFESTAATYSAAQIKSYLSTKLSMSEDDNYTSNKTLTSSISMYDASGNAVNNVSVYYKIVKTSYSEVKTTTDSPYIYNGLDFTGTPTSTQRTVTYNFQSLTTATSYTKPTGVTSYTISGTEAASYVITAYVGRYYHTSDGKTVMAQSAQYTVIFKVRSASFAEKEYDTDYLGAWRSNDLNYNYLIFDKTYSMSGRLVSSSTTEFTGYVFNKDEDGNVVSVSFTAGGKNYTCTLNYNGSLSVNDGSTTTNYVKYELS